MNRPKPALYGMLVACTIHSLAIAGEHGNMPKPAPQQLAWQEAELGIVFHYDLHGPKKGVRNLLREKQCRDLNG